MATDKPTFLKHQLLMFCDSFLPHTMRQHHRLLIFLVAKMDFCAGICPELYTVILFLTNHTWEIKHSIVLVEQTILCCMATIQSFVYLWNVYLLSTSFK